VTKCDQEWKKPSEEGSVAEWEETAPDWEPRTRLDQIAGLMKEFNASNQRLKMRDSDQHWHTLAQLAQHKEKLRDRDDSRHDPKP
jgi:hypothetical protein